MKPAGIQREIRIVGSLSCIMAFRMLGLFMLLPVLALYAHHLRGATALTIGLALGIYGLAQALFQIPFGTLADHIGRKPVIALGLLLFLVGSLVAASATDITTLIAGRFLQGMGAIGSTTLALLADLTRDEQRTRAMAVVGLAIGVSFSIAMALGPILSHHYGLEGIFLATAGFAVGGLFLLMFAVPPSPKSLMGSPTHHTRNRFKIVLRNTQLVRLDIGIFSLHAILTMVFVAMPSMLRHHAALTAQEQTHLYLIVLPSAFLIMLPIIILAEKGRKIRSVMLGCIFTLAITTLLSAVEAKTQHLEAWELGVLLLIFLASFSALEAMLPSLVSKLAPIRQKGGAMGVYSTSQFLGIFLGGGLGGTVVEYFGDAGVFLVATFIALCWLCIASSMKEPPYLSTLTFTVDHDQLAEHKLQNISNLPGVSEVSFSQHERVLYLKIDKIVCDINHIRNQIDTLRQATSY